MPKIKHNTVELCDPSKISLMRYPYEESRISFAVCDSIVKNKISVLTNICGCREELAQEVRTLIIGKKAVKFPKTCVMSFASSSSVKPDPKGNTGPRIEGPLVNGLIMRYPISYDKWMDKSAVAGLKLVNHFEKVNKWALTKAYKVIVGEKYADKYAYYFVGSKWWIYTPYNFSLFLLLLRLGRFEKIQALRSNMSKSTLVKTLKDMNVRSYSMNLVKDPEPWYILTKNMKEIHNHHEDMIGCWKKITSKGEGILDFVTGNTRDYAAFKKFAEIRKLYRNGSKSI